MALVKAFADKNFLRLNINKCEIVMLSRDQSTALPSCEVDGSILPADVGKCLGYWWKSDLLATKSVEENILKARRAFFHYGSIGVFQGDISPLSSRSVIECCVMPILMCGSENWILTEVLIDKLEAFQGELVKRVLKWPKHHSNTAAITAFEMPTMKSRLLVTKLGFLRRVMESSSGNFSGRVLEALCDDVESMCLVKECRELEESFGTQPVEAVIRGNAAAAKDMKETIYQQDGQKVVDRCWEKACSDCQGSKASWLGSIVGCDFGCWWKGC